jgi:AraC-like DNA-binding protein
MARTIHVCGLPGTLYCRNIRPTRTAFAHPRNSDLREFERFYLCPVEFGQLRRTLALQYIKDPGMSISQIAWLLGYEGGTSFNHAFKRWTGQSLFVARNEKRLPAPQ